MVSPFLIVQWCTKLHPGGRQVTGWPSEVLALKLLPAVAVLLAAISLSTSDSFLKPRVPGRRRPPAAVWRKPCGIL
jgi:hypothetical protein